MFRSILHALPSPLAKYFNLNAKRRAVIARSGHDDDKAPTAIQANQFQKRTHRNH